MEVLIDSIVELDKKGSTEILIIYNPHIKVGQKMKLICTTKGNLNISKMAIVSRLVPDYASSPTIKYWNVHLSSC